MSNYNYNLSHSVINISREEMLKKRLNELLPELMKKTGSDMWIIIGNENHLDPVMPTVLPENTDLGRLTIIVFCSYENKLERHVISRFFTESNDFYIASFDENYVDEWDCLKKIVDRCKPGNILLNYSENVTLADGLTHSNFKKLSRTLESYSNKFESSEELAIMWLNIQTNIDLEVYKAVVKKTEEIINNIFINSFISEISTEELEHRLSKKAEEYGMNVWYNKVDFQREGNNLLFNKGSIKRGDLIHCDFGIRHLGISSDIQKLFYLPKEDENVTPRSFNVLLEQAHQLQDIVSAGLSKGCTGDEVLNNALNQMKKKDINGRVYTHPLGYYGHGSVPIIGRYNQQKKVPIEGNYLAYDNTFWAIELCVIGNIPEWNNQRVHILVEDSAILFDNKIHFISERQQSIALLKP
ncbi:MAG: M24 family metallopeptidase [Petrotogales bacterium]